MHSLAVFLLAAPLIAEAKSKCQGLVWNVDEKLNMCLAKHCCKATKDGRSYPDPSTCAQYLMVDQFSCGGGVDHKGMCDTKDKDHSCPEGQSCTWGPFGFGFCCDEANEAVWSKEYAAECKAPLTTVAIPNSVEDSGRKTPLQGKSCKDNFCPKGAKCVQGKYLAHCCA